jgi:hypothetical protein
VSAPGPPQDNPWRWHAEADPYRHDAFGVLGIGPSTALRRAHAASRRQQVRYGTVTHHGRALDEAAINAAEQRLRDPAGRVAETLRVHEPGAPEPTAADLVAELERLDVPACGPVALTRETLLVLLPPSRPQTAPPPVPPPVPAPPPLHWEDFA